MPDVETRSGAELPSIVSEVPGPRSRALLARLEPRECPAFASRRDARAKTSGDDLAPIVLSRGLGANVWDADGNRYVDLAAGFGAVTLGHGAVEVAEAVRESTGLAQGLGDLYASERKIELVERLARLHPDPGARVLLCQSGADAITAALKTAALATGKHGLVAFDGGYHGLGYAPLAACGFRPSFREPFAPELNPAVRFAPFPKNDQERAASLGAIERALAIGDVAAVLIEPIQGRGGVVVPPRGFLAEVAALAKRAGALVVADEIWTGLGRSGSLARTLDEGVVPDLVAFGKGLGGGVSISACIGTDESMRGWARGGEVVHTSTHAGAPIAAAAAIAVLGRIAKDDLAARAARVGAAFREAIARRAEKHPGVVEVRGEGLMIGIEHRTGRLALRTMQGLLERGVVVTIGGQKGEVVVLTPPLTIASSLFEPCAALFDATWTAASA